MLPILRIIPVGGVLLAITILVLALNPPVGPHMHLTAAMMPARGALISRDDHPEWRQFLILAALRRADELSKLRDLPDTPTRTAPLVSERVVHPKKPQAARPADTGKLAGVQANPTGQSDVTGTVQSPDAAMPVDIGESSSTELPVIPHEERPPVIMMPAHNEPPPAAEPTPAGRTKPKTAMRAPAPAAAKQASREAGSEPVELKQPAQPKQQSKAAAPAATTSKQASREPAPAAPKQEGKTAASAPPPSKQARREAAPAPTKSKPKSPPIAQALPKTKEARLELPPARPKPKHEIRRVLRERAKPRREIRRAVRERARPRRYARLARRPKVRQTVQPFNFFQFFFEYDAKQPGPRIPVE